MCVCKRLTYIREGRVDHMHMYVLVCARAKSHYVCIYVCL